MVYSQHGIHCRGCRYNYGPWRMFGWHLLNALSFGILGTVYYHEDEYHKRGGISQDPRPKTKDRRPLIQED